MGYSIDKPNSPNLNVRSIELYFMFRRNAIVTTQIKDPVNQMARTG